MAVPNLWRTKKQRYSLQGETCPACTQAVFPSRAVCPHCGEAMQETAHHEVQPEMYSFSMMLVPTQATAVSVAGDD